MDLVYESMRLENYHALLSELNHLFTIAYAKPNVANYIRHLLLSHEFDK